MSVPAEVAGADLAESRGLHEAASYVLDLLDRPASDIRVADGQIGLDDEVVVEGRPEGFSLEELSPADPGTVWAIDGGSCIVADGRSFQVAATRTSRVRFRAGSTDLVEAPPLEVRALSRDRMESLSAVLAERMGTPLPQGALDARRPVDVLRECGEWEGVRATVREAGPGDVVLVDGSLHGGPWVAAEFVRMTHAEAVDRNVSLVGVVKASTLFWGRSAPLVPLLKRRGDRELGAVGWAARISTDPAFGRLYVGDIFVAHLAPTAPHAFRVDVASGPASGFEVLSRVAGCATDAAFVGYPYPLARAHRAARVSGWAVADLRRTFRTNLAQLGMPEADIEVLFQDFHEVLNRS